MKIVKLGEIATVSLSNVDKKSKPNQKNVLLCNFVDVYHNWAITEYNKKDFLIATANDNEINRFTLKKGDVAITKDSETRDDIGISTYIAEDIEDLILGYHTALIRPNEDILLGKYLNIVLHSPLAQKYFEYNASGSGQRYTLTLETIQNFPVPLPNIEDQKQLGALCSNIDRKINNNKSIISELESMAKTLYDYWFLQFEFPNEEGKPYKSSGGKMVWNEELKRDIPEGWLVGNLYDIATFTNGLACQKYRPTDDTGALPVIKITEMHDGITNKTEHVRDDIDSKYIINDGDILFSWSATLEVMFWNNGKGGLNQHIFKIEPKGSYNKCYVFSQLSAYVINFVKMAEARKTTMGHITSDHLKQSRIPLPPIKLANIFEKNVSKIFDNITNLANQNKELKQLRDFLLPMLMNGQVTFKKEGESIA